MLRKPIVGIIGFSDGDPEVHEELKDIVQKQVDDIEEALRGSGQVEVIVADKLVASERDAKEQAELLRSRGVDITVFSYGVFAFPNFSAIAARNGKGPFVLAANLNPDWPGMVAMLAAGPAQRTEIRTDRWTEPWDVQRSGQYAGLAETIRRRY